MRARADAGVSTENDVVDRMNVRWYIKDVMKWLILRP